MALHKKKSLIKVAYHSFQIGFQVKQLIVDLGTVGQTQPNIFTVKNISEYGCVPNQYILVYNLDRDDTHMTFLKIFRFSRHPPPVHLRPKFFHPLDLGRPISNEPPPSPRDNQSVKRDHDPRMTVVCY